MSLKKFYADPYYQIRSFALNTLFAVAASAALYAWHDTRFYAWNFSAIHLLFVPLGIYLGGLSCVWIHNATHKSFPNQTLNDACGWLAGLHQLWGYRGWKLIHLIHHQYSDVEGSDPHPTKNRAFGAYLRSMFVCSSRTVTKRYAEHWKDRSHTKQLQTVGMVAFFAMAASFLTFWYMLLGRVGFVLGYIPSIVWNHYLFASINYYCHPLNKNTNETEATNRTAGLYYKAANALWHDMYFHGNHHKNPSLFNPKHLLSDQNKKVISALKRAA